MKLLLRRLLGLAFFAAITTRVAAYQSTQAGSTDPGSGISFQLELPLRETPGSGFYPIHLTIINKSNSAHSWDVSFSTGNPGMGTLSMDYRVTVGTGPNEQ